MKNVRKIRNVNLKKIMINKKIPRCKSASWDAQKGPEKNKEAKANYNDLKVMKNKNEDVDFDNYVGTMFVDISISRNLEDYISVRPF